MGEINYINEKIHTVKFKIRRLERKQRSLIKKENNKRRKERAQKLLKLGLIFEMTLTDIYSPEVLIGHLIRLSLKEQSGKEQFKFEGNKIIQNKGPEKHDKEVVSYLNTEDRKRRNHKLISLGALFESTDNDAENIALLIGYMEKLHLYNQEERDILEIQGKQFFYTRRRKKYGKNMENVL